MAKVNHISHGMGEHATGRPGSDITRMAPKRVHAIEVAHGMRTRSQSGADALSGHEASAIDSLTGNVAVPGKVTATPGWGNQGISAASGHPFAKAPGTKRLTPAAPAFGMTGPGMVKPDGKDLHALGEAMLAEAFAASDGADCAAHGRNKDGSRK